MKKKQPVDLSALRALSFLTQAGLSFCIPLVFCVWGAGVLKNRFGLGNGVMLAGLLVGLYAGISGFIGIIRSMDHMTKQAEEEAKDRWMK